MLSICAEQKRPTTTRLLWVMPLGFAVVGAVSIWQLEGYDKIDYMKYFALARDKAKEVMDGKYGSYDLLPYDALWAIGNRNKVEHIWSLQTVSNDDIYGVSFGEGYAGVLGTAGETYGLHHGMHNHWYKRSLEPNGLGNQISPIVKKVV